MSRTITKAHFVNLRCLKNVEIELGPLTCFVGANASGKSTLLRALRADRGLASADGWMQRNHKAISREFRYSDGGHEELARGTGRQTHQTQTLQLRIDRLRLAVRLQHVKQLDQSGGELANVLATLPRRRLDQVATDYCAMLPEYQDLDVRPASSQGNHQLVFEDRWTDGLWYTPDQVSDGTLLMAAYVALPWQEQPPDLITIEEPERGLHPYLLGRLVDLLRKISTGEIGSRPVQIVMATHSAELLDHLRPEEVRFVRRRKEDGATEVEAPPTDSDRWEAAFEAYREELGAMWLSGALGGVPGR